MRNYINSGNCMQKRYLPCDEFKFNDYEINYNCNPCMQRPLPPPCSHHRPNNNCGCEQIMLIIGGIIIGKLLD